MFNTLDFYKGLKSEEGTIFVIYFLSSYLMNSYLPNDVFSLIFLLKFLIWNKMAFQASNSLNFPALVENKLKKTFLEYIKQYAFLYTIFHCLM